MVLHLDQGVDPRDLLLVQFGALPVGSKQRGKIREIQTLLGRPVPQPPAVGENQRRHEVLPRPEDQGRVDQQRFAAEQVLDPVRMDLLARGELERSVAAAENPQPVLGRELAEIAGVKPTLLVEDRDVTSSSSR